jgi:hypothetical protein
MTIPRELRDQICNYVIRFQQRERPALNQTFEELIHHRSIPRKPKLQSWCKEVLYYPEDAVANTSSLLRVNRQLHAETLKNIELIKGCVYELDVIVLDEILPLPTWICVPFYTNSIEQINTTFRISGYYDKMKHKRGPKGSKDLDGPYVRFGRYKGFRIGNGAGPAISWEIYSILERFFKAGPAGAREGEEADEHRHMTVKTIDINVETPPDIHPARFAHPKSGGYSTREGDVDESVLNPTILARFIESNIGGLLSSTDYDWFSYGKVLLEHVDTVVVRLDGKELRVFDVAECLELVGGFNERYISKIALEAYKAQAWKIREERGLKVLRDSA